MKNTYRIDIDGTIAEPRFFDEDMQACCAWYLREGIVTVQEVASVQRHQQLFLLPQVLRTHVPIAGAVEALQWLVQGGESLAYFSVRQARDPIVCLQVHQHTRTWLHQWLFPYPEQAHFFWDVGDKLVQSLAAPEEQVFLLDDRPHGLVEAYQKITRTQPEQAQQIHQRVTVLAFGMETVASVPVSALRVMPCPSWSYFLHRYAHAART